MLVYDQNALAMGSRRCRLEQELQTALVDLLGIPAGFGEKPLQTLRFLALGPYNGFGVGQSRQGLVALGREQEPFQVAPETFPLGARPKKMVETDSVLFEGSWSGGNGQSLGHDGASLLPPLEHGRHLMST